MKSKLEMWSLEMFYLQKFKFLALNLLVKLIL